MKGYVNLYVSYWFQYFRSLRNQTGEHSYTAAQAYKMAIDDPFEDWEICLG